MFDASLSFIKEFHFNVGPVKVDLGDVGSRRNTAALLLILGIVIYLFPGLPLGAYLPKFINDVLNTFGLIAIIVGVLLAQLR